MVARLPASEFRKLMVAAVNKTILSAIINNSDIYQISKMEN